MLVLKKSFFPALAGKKSPLVLTGHLCPLSFFSSSTCFITAAGFLGSFWKTLPAGTTTTSTPAFTPTPRLRLLLLIMHFYKFWCCCSFASALGLCCLAFLLPLPECWMQLLLRITKEAVGSARMFDSLFLSQNPWLGNQEVPNMLSQDFQRDSIVGLSHFIIVGMSQQRSATPTKIEKKKKKKKKHLLICCRNSSWAMLPS